MGVHGDSLEVATAQHETDKDLRAIPLDLPQRELFAQQYVIDFNGAQAAIRAGYAPKNAGSQATRLLKNANVLARIRHLVQRRQAITEVAQARVVLELARVAFSDIGEVAQWGPDGVKVVPSEDLDPHTRAAIQSVKCRETVVAVLKDGTELKQVETEIKMHPKAPAYRLLSEHTGPIGKGAEAGKSPRVTLWSGRNRDE